MEAQPPAFGIFGAKAMAHDFGPHASRRPEFGDLFQEVVVRVEEKGDLVSKTVNIQAGVDGRLHISNAIRQGKRNFLNGRAACFSNVIT